MSDEAIKETLIQFIAQMQNWEISCSKRTDESESGLLTYEDSSRIAMQDYHEIFSTFCSSKATPRTFHYQKPPSYNADTLQIERVENVSDSLEVRVYLQSNDPFQTRYVFRLIRECDKWKIHSKFRIASNGQWRVEDL